MSASRYDEYRQRVEFLYDFLEKNGVSIDKQNRNPSRLSRMPGVTRNGNRQYLVDTNIGRKSWAEWMDYAEGIADELPGMVALSEFKDDPPTLPEELITGILRRGHKMLISGSSKAGKSFLLMELCIAIAEGRSWLSFPCKKGRVLYYVEGNHEAIIDPKTFELVQREMARRTKGKNRHSGVHLFSGKIKCGGWYGSKVWHSNDVYMRTIWQCNQKYKNEKRCTTPYLDEVTIKSRFLTAANSLLAGRTEAIRICEAAIKTVFDLTDLQTEQARLHAEMELLSGMMEESIRQNATVAQDQAEYQKHFDDLSQRFDAAKQQHGEVTVRISDMKSRKGDMVDFLELLKKQADEVPVFSDGLWTGLLDYATVYADGRMTFTFKNGQTIDG